jgi:hypothetical protein
VRWTPPASNGGSPITGYEIYYGAELRETEPASARQSSVGGLTNGVQYRFTVRARNAVGLGPPSALSNQVTPTPSVPTTTTTTPPPSTTDPPACDEFCEFLNALEDESVEEDGETIAEFLDRLVILLDEYL